MHSPGHHGRRPLPLSGQVCFVDLGVSFWSRVSMYHRTCPDVTLTWQPTASQGCLRQRIHTHRPGAPSYLRPFNLSQASDPDNALQASDKLRALLPGSELREAHNGYMRLQLPNENLPPVCTLFIRFLRCCCPSCRSRLDLRHSPLLLLGDLCSTAYVSNY